MKISNLTLTNNNDREFDLRFYQLETIPALKTPLHPLVIIIPGGSFNHFSIRESEPTALAFLNYGYQACIMHYNLVQDPGKIYPDAALDVLKTVEYFRSHADQYAINPQQIVTLGYSAGGHVASAANYVCLAENYQREFKVSGQAAVPNATILGYPLINIDKIGFKISPVDRQSYPDDPKLLDTALGVTESTPPTFIFQSFDDQVCLIDNSLEYAQALASHHVSSEVHLFERGGHGYALAAKHLVQTGKEWQDNPHAEHWFKLALEWLDLQFS